MKRVAPQRLRGKRAAGVRWACGAGVRAPLDSVSVRCNLAKLAGLLLAQRG